jgi:acetyl-CoA C-acetyltransferase
MSEVVIVSSVRTAVGGFGGGLKEVPAAKLGAIVIKDVLKRIGLKPKSGKDLLSFCPGALADQGQIDLEKGYYDWPSELKEIQVDEVIMGNVLTAGQGQNPARQAMIYAGVPKETPAFTVNKVCGSGAKAIVMAAQSILLGDAEVVIAGGMENMSMVPYAMPRARWGYRMDISGKGEVLDLMVYDGLWELYYGYHMGITAENIAARYSITREEQDKLGVMSHQRAMAAIKDGTFKQEIVPVVMPQKKGDPVVFDTDERPMETSLEKMAKLAPAFKKDGTVTAGNASGINDGAGAVLLMSARKARELGLEPLARIKSYASGALDPAYMGLGVVPAVKKALAKAKLTVKDLDYIELNEAFAAQALGCVKELGFDLDKTNLHGSGISLGHPVGATGARLMVTLTHEMKRRNLKQGLITMCIGGGQGIAMVVER